MISLEPPVNFLARTMMSDVSLQYHEQEIESGWGVEVWLIAFAVLALAVAAIAFYVLRKRRSVGNEPVGLLLELCDIHKLNRGSRHLLTHLATASELKQPAVMLVSPDLFEATLERVVRKKPLTSQEQKSLEQLRHRLFAI